MEHISGRRAGTGAFHVVGAEDRLRPERPPIGANEWLAMATLDAMIGPQATP
jgi:hypothetical protein